MRLITCQRANALIEFALVLPLLLAFLLGMIEMGRYTIIQQKLDKVTFAMADFVTQSTTVRESDLNGFVLAVPEIMKPFNFSGSVIFSSVTVPSAAIAGCPVINITCIAWQRRPLGGDTSRIGAQGGGATLPGGYAIIAGQDVIVAEVFYDYTPLIVSAGNFIPAFGPHQLYKAAVYKPRQGMLTQIAP